MRRHPFYIDLAHPVRMNDHLLVPMQFVSEDLSYAVEWDENLNMATIIIDESTAKPPIVHLSVRS